MDFFNIGGIGALEVLFILLIAFILFGPDKLPEIARGAGKAMRELKKYTTAMTSDLKAEFDKEVNKEVDKEITKEINAPPANLPTKPQAASDTSKSPEITPPKVEEIKQPNKNE